ncbi:MAG: metal ABC transporter solute-binding protein, Zn/Mn family [Jatrophihabitantaceae bacterium]
MRGGRSALVVAVTTAVAVTSACSSMSTAASGQLQVVASTDVYADLVRAVTGDRAQVTAFLDDPSQDPHSFEASPRDQLAIAGADVIVENGGGYDDFVDRLRAASGEHGAVTIDAVTLSGHVAPAGGELNEHVWYDLPSMRRLVERLVAVLSAKRPGDSAVFVAGARRFIAGLSDLERVESSIRARYGGTPVAITEPVPVYLLTACGLVNRTPAQFSAGIEGGGDVSVSVLSHTLDLFDHHAVRTLVYNEQTSGAETTRLLAAAAANHIPSVPVTETLPAGASYLSWMRENLSALQAALAAT